VADDGSAQETAKLIEKATADYSSPLIHAWHEDNGFRAAAIRNLAKSKSSGDYLVFLDGVFLVFGNTAYLAS
jgi:glycosyltransferase involved in cell wall biosynthesis